MSVALLIGLGLLASFDAYACIPSDRYQSSGDYALEDENGAEARAIYYYIQSDFGTRLSHCTPTPEDDSNPEHWVRRVIQGAAEHWNTNAQGIPLLYGGTVPTDLPPDACLNHMIKRPAIFVRLVEGCDLNGTTMCQNTLASVRSIFDCSDAVTLTIYANRNQNPNLSVSDCSAIEAGSHNYAYGRLLEFGGLSNRINLP